MALLDMASFDIYDTANVLDHFAAVGLGTIVAAAGRCGTAAWHGTGALGSGPFGAAAATTTSGYAGYAYYPTGITSTEIFGVWRSSLGGNLAFARHLNDGSIELWKGADGSIGSIVATSATGLLNLNHYVHLGFEWNIAASGGYFRCYVNGVLVADSGSIDMTTAFTSGQWTGANFLPVGYIDDCYWGDTAGASPWNAFLGDLTIKGDVALTDASGGGLSHDFTPSSGTDHGALVDDAAPDDDTTYLQSQTVGNVETLKFPNITSSTTRVFGVQLLPNAMRTEFTPRSIACVLQTVSNIAVGTNQALAETTYRYYPQMYQVDPITSAEWTIADVDTTYGGIKLTV